MDWLVAVSMGMVGLVKVGQAWHVALGYCMAGRGEERNGRAGQARLGEQCRDEARRVLVRQARRVYAWTGPAGTERLGRARLGRQGEERRNKSR